MAALSTRREDPRGGHRRRRPHQASAARGGRLAAHRRRGSCAPADPGRVRRRGSGQHASHDAPGDAAAGRGARARARRGHGGVSADPRGAHRTARAAGAGDPRRRAIGARRTRLRRPHRLGDAAGPHRAARGATQLRPRADQARGGEDRGRACEAAGRDLPHRRGGPVRLRRTHPADHRVRERPHARRPGGPTRSSRASASAWRSATSAARRR